MSGSNLLLLALTVLFLGSSLMAVPVNPSFEDGLKGWGTVKDSTIEGAVVEVVDHPDAADGRKVVRFYHPKTASSYLRTDFKLEPYTFYLLSVDVRTDTYARVGMGLFPRLWIDGMNPGDRIKGANLGDGWTRLYLAFPTGATGQAQLRLNFSATAGEAFYDNLRLEAMPREKAIDIIGTGYSGAVLRVPPREGTAQARVWYDEIPVTVRAPSHITLQTAIAMEDEAWTASGAVYLELPEEIAFKSEGATRTDLGNGLVRYSMPASKQRKIGRDYWWTLFLRSEQPIERTTARLWAEWDGGRQTPVEVPLFAVELPRVKQPVRLRAGTTSYAVTPGWYEDYAGLFASLGFNMIDYWGYGSGKEHLPALREKGFAVGGEHSGFSTIHGLLPKYPDAVSVEFRNHKRKETVIDASHEGGLRDELVRQIRAIAEAGYNGVVLDDEHYRDWASLDTCVCDRCKARWAAYIEETLPGTEYVEPEAVLSDPLAHQKLHVEWFRFRAMLVSEWYVEAREAFEAAVAEHGGDPEEVWFASYTGKPSFGRMKDAFMDPRQMLDVVDYFFPMYYEQAEDLARSIPPLVEAVGPERAGAALCFGEARSHRYEWRPGDMRAQILQAIFAGGKAGYLIWSWPYTNMRIIAEVAEANGVVAENEQILLDGTRSLAFRASAPEQHATALELDGEGLLLVANYATDRSTVRLRKTFADPVRLVGQFDEGTVEMPLGTSFLEVAVPTRRVALFRYTR